MSFLKYIEQDSQAEQPSRMSEMRARHPPPVVVPLQSRVQSKMLAELDPMIDISNTEEIRRVLEELFDNALSEENIILSRVERQRLFEQVVAEVLGLGPLEPLLSDRSVDEIMVNGPRQIYVERKGRLERTNLVFESNDHLRRIIDRIVLPLGRRIDESSPYVDACLPCGSPVNIIIPPLSLVGPTITIHESLGTSLDIEDIIRIGTITPEAMGFLMVCVQARLRIVICGTASSGKTTFLKLLANFIPDDERVVVIGDLIHELPPPNVHLQHLSEDQAEHRGPGLTLYEQVRIAAGIQNARLILPHAKQSLFWTPQVLETLAKTSYLAEVGGRSSQSALLRLANLCLQHGVQWPPERAFRAFTNGLDLVICLTRMYDGTRKVISIDEVSRSGMAELETRPIFAFQREGAEKDRIIGQLRPTGYQPDCLRQIEAYGV